MLEINVRIDLKKVLYFAVQKIIGIVLIFGSICMCMKWNDGDVTICFITVPLGLALLFTRHRMMDLGILGDSEEYRPKRRVRRSR